MLNTHTREVLMHALHACKATVDQVASYLMNLDKFSAGLAASLPCPRCYARREVHALVMSLAGEDLLAANCECCATLYDFRKST